MNNTCCNCYQPPLEFEADSGELGYWIIVPKGSQDFAYLMSNGELKLKIGLDIEYIENDSVDYWCLPCVEARLEE